MAGVCKRERARKEKANQRMACVCKLWMMDDDDKMMMMMDPDDMIMMDYDMDPGL